MIKKKTSDMQKKSIKTTRSTHRTLNKKHPGLTICNPIVHLTDKSLLNRAIQECIEADDYEGVIEVTNIYLEAKKSLAKQTKAKRPRTSPNATPPITTKTTLKTPIRRAPAGVYAKKAKKSRAK